MSYLLCKIKKELSTIVCPKHGQHLKVNFEHGKIELIPGYENSNMIAINIKDKIIREHLRTNIKRSQTMQGAGER